MHTKTNEKLTKTKEQIFIDMIESNALDGSSIMTVSHRSGGGRRVETKFFLLDESTGDGVFMALNAKDDLVFIVYIITTIFHKGYGTKFMKWLCKKADEAGITLSLDPYPQARGIKINQLKKWYRGFGFKPNKKKYIRKPNNLDSQMKTS